MVNGSTEEEEKFTIKMNRFSENLKRKKPPQ